MTIRSKAATKEYRDGWERAFRKRREVVVLPSLAFDYDPWSDVLTVQGVKYSGELFRCLGVGGLATDTWIRIMERRDGRIVLTYRNECPTCGLHDTRDAKTQP